MNRTLLTDVLTEFNALNGIPVFVCSEQGVVFKTLTDEILRPDAEVFLKELIENKAEIRQFNGIEYFAVIPIKGSAKKETIVLGAAYAAHPVNVGFKGRLQFERAVKRERLNEFLLSVKTVSEEEFVRYVSVVSRLAGNPQVRSARIARSEPTLRRVLNGQLTEYVFETRENELSPYAPESERRIMDMVKAGDVEGTKRIETGFKTDAPGLQVKYLFKIVALVTVATRAATEGGVDPVNAYGLSDLYLSELSRTTNERQITDIAKNILPHFAELVKKQKSGAGRGDSPYLAGAERYIKTHLHFPIRLKAVADEVGIGEKYLSRLFVTVKGEKFTRYVNRARVYEAKELLTVTDRTLTDIAYSLAFVSESYFIKVFQQIAGVTPQKFRKMYGGALQGFVTRDRKS